MPLFSLDAFTKEVEICDGRSVYLPTDHDLTVLLRQHINDIPEAKEYLFRQHSRRALWKTQVEFTSLFPQVTTARLIKIASKAKKVLSEITDGLDFVVQPIPDKAVVIETGEIMIQIGNSCSSYKELLGEQFLAEKKKSFYVFAPRECSNRYGDFIKALQRL